MLWVSLLNFIQLAQFLLWSFDKSQARRSPQDFSSPHCFTYLGISCLRAYTLLLGSFLSFTFLHSLKSYSYVSHLEPLSQFRVSLLVSRTECCPINFSKLVNVFPHEDAIASPSDLFQLRYVPYSDGTCFDYFCCRNSSLCQRNDLHQLKVI